MKNISLECVNSQRRYSRSGTTDPRSIFLSVYAGDGRNRRTLWIGVFVVWLASDLAHRCLGPSLFWTRYLGNAFFADIGTETSFIDGNAIGRLGLAQPMDRIRDRQYPTARAGRFTRNARDQRDRLLSPCRPINVPANSKQLFFDGCRSLLSYHDPGNTDCLTTSIGWAVLFHPDFDTRHSPTERGLGLDHCSTDFRVLGQSARIVSDRARAIGLCVSGRRHGYSGPDSLAEHGHGEFSRQTVLWIDGAIRRSRPAEPVYDTTLSRGFLVFGK